MKFFYRTFGLTVLLLVSLPLTCSALQQPSATAARKSPARARRVQSSPTSSPEVTHAANQAAGRTPQQPKDEDEEAAFKYSAAVKGIAKITGLSPVAAYWVCVFINFAIVAIAIVFAMKSNLAAMFRGRTQDIQKGMAEARRASEDARHRLEEIEARLSRMDVEIGEMQKHAEAEARVEEDRLRASIDEEKHKILDAAKLEVTQATNAARRELQKYAVTLAVEMAEKGIRVDASEDKVLVEDFSEQLASEARRNGGSS